MKVNEKRREKAVLINELHDSRLHVVCTKFLRLLEITIDEKRTENDDLDGPPLYRNQGMIKGCKGLIEDVTQGLPTRQFEK